MELVGVNLILMVQITKGRVLVQRRARELEIQGWGWERRPVELEIHLVGVGGGERGQRVTGMKTL